MSRRCRPACRVPVRARLASLIDRHHITLALIERRLLLAGDLPGLKLRSTLERGSRDGGARLVLDGQADLVSGSITLDDRLPASLRTWELGGSTALNDAMGLGEQLYATATSGWNLGQAINGDSPERILGAGVIVPLGSSGLTLNPEYVDARTTPAPVAGVPATEGVFDRVRYALPIRWCVRAPSRSMARLAYEHVAETIHATTFDTELSEDRYHVLRPGVGPVDQPLTPAELVGEPYGVAGDRRPKSTGGHFRY